MSRIVCLTVVLCLTTLSSVAQPILVGTTATNSLHIGSGGRSIAVEPVGSVQLVWQNYYDWGWSQRQAYYNAVENGNPWFSSEGIVVDAGIRSGFPRLAVSTSGFCFPAYHSQQSSSSPVGTAVACDFMAHAGAFSNCMGDSVPVLANRLYPRVAADREGDVHLLCCDYTASEDVHRYFYSRGTPQYDDGFLNGIDWTISSVPNDFGPSISVSTGCDIACYGERVARSWAASTPDRWNTPYAFSNDVFVQFSEDRGLNWGDPTNLTMFEMPDQECFNSGTNPICCNRDTLRATPDVNIMYDADGELHIVFTTLVYYNWESALGEAGFYPTRAQVWHWGEDSGEFSIVANAWIDGPLPGFGSLGSNRTYVEGPVISQDSSSGTLYCTFTEYDTSHYAVMGGLFNADIMVSSSTDGGDSWSVRTDVTPTVPTINPVPAGENLIEQDVSVNQWILDGWIDMSYLLDVNGVAGPTDPLPLNPIYYETIPVGMIQSTPLIADQDLHVGTVDECLESLTSDEAVVPSEFALAAYPNPFNSTVTLQYTLPINSFVTLRVFDVSGRETARLIDGPQSMGDHEYSWKAENAATGVYFARLETVTGTRTSKLLLIK